MRAVRLLTLGLRMWSVTSAMRTPDVSHSTKRADATPGPGAAQRASADRAGHVARPLGHPGGDQALGLGEVAAHLVTRVLHAAGDDQLGEQPVARQERGEERRLV